MSDHGGISVPVRSAWNSMPWPTAVDPSLVSFLQEGLGQAVRFVVDRADLCALLSASNDVHRANFHAWLPVANYPARLVQALVLARDIGHDDLEAEILAKLRGGPVYLSDGRTMEVAKWAKSWAAKYSSVLGFNIAI